jgi:nucleoside triphosphate pyrophosphatase
MKIILASQSKRRKQLLSWLLDDFEIITANINEKELGKLARTPQEMVMNLAKAKVKKVWETIGRNALQCVSTKTIIIGADTIGILPDNKPWQAIEKPKNKQEAISMLKKLRDQTHQVYSGICVMYGRDAKSYVSTVSDFIVSRVTFGNFSDEVLMSYVDSGKPMDKAAAYGIQEIEKEFDIKVDGSYSNVVGLPLARLSQILLENSVKLKPNWQERIKKETGYKD